MHIMTEDGWRVLHPPVSNQVWELHGEKGDIPRLTFMGHRPGLLPPSAEGAFYVGHFPSERACEFINGMKEKLKYFDDGERLVYGKKSRHVEVDNAVPEHPMDHPPEGWVFSHNTGTFVQRKSKYE